MRPILIDFDGVIADLHSEWIRLYNEKWNDDLRPEEVVHWDISGFVKREAQKGVFEILGWPGLYDNVQPLPDAIESLRALTSLRVPWVIATTCSYHNMIRGKSEWLYRHGLTSSEEYPADRMIIVRDKGLLRGLAMVDDYHENLDSFKGPGILFDKPYNQESNHIRFAGWKDALPYLLGFVQKEVFRGG